MSGAWCGAWPGGIGSVCGGSGTPELSSCVTCPVCEGSARGNLLSARRRCTVAVHVEQTATCQATAADSSGDSSRLTYRRSSTSLLQTELVGFTLGSRT